MNATNVTGWSFIRPTAGMMRALLLAAGILLGLASPAVGQKKDPNHGVVFLYPTNDLIYHTMDTVEVTYTSPFPTPNLYTFCDGGSRQVGMQPVPGYNATVAMLLNFTSATPCWFNLRPGTVAGYGANTPPFSIIGQERDGGGEVFGVDSATTTTSSSSSSSSTTTASSTSSTTAATTTTETETETTTASQTQGSSSSSSSSSSSTSGSGASAPTDNQSQPDNESQPTGLGASSTTAPGSGSGGGDSLSAGAAGGIGAGVAVGILAVAGGIFAWLWRRKRRDRAMEEVGDGGESRHGGTATSTTSGGSQGHGSVKGDEEDDVMGEERPPAFVPSVHASQESYYGYQKQAYFSEVPRPSSPVEIGTSLGLRLKHELPG